MSEKITANLKQLADEGKLEDLAYQFAYAFGADPTFQEYQGGYDYCRAKGIFRPHEELTPFQKDEAAWNEEYFENLQEDLKKNLSCERLDHMRKVARVVFKDKIDKMSAEPSREPAQKPQPAAQTAPERIVGGVGQTPEEIAKIQNDIRIGEQSRPVSQPPAPPVQPAKPVHKPAEDRYPKKARGGLLPLLLAVVIVLLLILLFSQGSKAMEEPPIDNRQSGMHSEGRSLPPR